MGIRSQLAALLAEHVRMMTGPRIGFTYALVARSSDPSWKSWLTTAPEHLDPDTATLLRLAGAEGGVDCIEELTYHLECPAPRHSLIAAFYNDGWLASDDPETIYRITGLREINRDGRPHYSFIRGVPARLLRDELLDFREAWIRLEGHDHWSGRQSPRQHVWEPEGTHNDAMAEAIERTIDEDEHSGGSGVSLSNRDSQRWTWLSKDPWQFRLYQSRVTNHEHNFWQDYEDDTAVALPRDTLKAYLDALPEWPPRLAPTALFYIYAESIIRLGPLQWLREMGIEG